MNQSQLSAKADRLRSLHSGKILVLPNAWDVASARVVEQAGFPAVASSSAGVAAVLGYPDGQLVSRDEMLDLVGRMARALEVPLTADLESGYGDAGKTVEAALDAGAVGMNLEDLASGGRDLLVPIAAHEAAIGAARAAGDRRGVHFVINARTDVYLASVGEPESRFDHAVQRGRAYLAAGADCVFVPGVRDEETIGKLVKAIGGPINILVGPGSPSVQRLAALGVARVSAGSGPQRAAHTAARRAAEELRDRGTCTFAEGIMTWSDVNALLARK